MTSKEIEKEFFRLEKKDYKAAVDIVRQEIKKGNDEAQKFLNDNMDISKKIVSIFNTDQVQNCKINNQKEWNKFKHQKKPKVKPKVWKLNKKKEFIENIENGTYATMAVNHGLLLSKTEEEKRSLAFTVTILKHAFKKIDKKKMSDKLYKIGYDLIEFDKKKSTVSAIILYNN